MESLAGKLLIAHPRMTDPNFARSVVLVLQHDPNGALGLVLNRPLQVSATDLFAAIDNALPSGGNVGNAWLGGPVQTNAVMVLHGYADEAGARQPAVPGVYLSTDPAELARLLERCAGEGAPRLRIFCGYAGWGEKQLDGEMETGSWLKAPASSSLVFESDHESLWRRVLASLGGEYGILAYMPPHPELN